MINVFLVDDHAIMRDGLRRLISDTTDLHVVGRSIGQLTVLARAAQEKWDILLYRFFAPGHVIPRASRSSRR